MYASGYQKRGLFLAAVLKHDSVKMIGVTDKDQCKLVYVVLPKTSNDTGM